MAAGNGQEQSVKSGPAHSLRGLYLNTATARRGVAWCGVPCAFRTTRNRLDISELPFHTPQTQSVHTQTPVLDRVSLYRLKKQKKKNKAQ